MSDSAATALAIVVVLLLVTLLVLQRRKPSTAAPGRRTAAYVFAIYHGVISVLMLGVAIFLVFRSAIFEPRVRIALAIALVVGALIVVASKLRDLAKGD
jgi:hypothetical protein